MGTRIKNFDATGIPPNGELFAGDLNAMQDQYADLVNLAQAVSVGTLAVGESGLQLLRYGAGEARISGAVRTDGILRALGGMFAGAFTTTQRDAIAVGFRPYGLLILNSTNNRLEMNFGTDATPQWLGLSAGITRNTGAPPTASSANVNQLYFRTDLNGGTLYYSDGVVWTQLTAGLTAPATTVVDGSITLAKLDPRFASPFSMYGLMMVEGVLAHVDAAAGDPRTALATSFASAWDVLIAVGRALIQGDDAATQGMYLYSRQVAANFTLPTHAPAGNNRWDIIGVQYNDADYTGRTPANAPSIVQVVGTPNAAAVVGPPPNFAGMAALPASTVPLAYVLIKPTDVSLVAGQILDARKVAGPGIWGEDGHRYRLGIDSTATLGTELVV